MKKGLNDSEIKKEFIRSGHRVLEVTTYKKKGKVIHKLVTPINLKFRFRDAIQLMIGSAILAIPVGFTEETWALGQKLPIANILLLLLLSIFFISMFVYHHSYKQHIHIKQHLLEYVKRVLATYLVSFVVVAILLTIIKIAPWQTNFLLALKRTIIVSFPASMSAAIADTIK